MSDLKELVQKIIDYRTKTKFTDSQIMRLLDYENSNLDYKLIELALAEATKEMNKPKLIIPTLEDALVKKAISLYIKTNGELEQSDIETIFLGKNYDIKAVLDLLEQYFIDNPLPEPKPIEPVIEQPKIEQHKPVEVIPVEQSKPIEQIQPEQPTPTRQPKPRRTPNKSINKFSRFVGLRLPHELFDSVKENPTELIKQALKDKYGK